MAGRPKRGTKGGEKKVMRGNKQGGAEAVEADKEAPKAQGSRKQANKVEKVEIDNVDKAPEVSVRGRRQASVASKAWVMSS